VALLLCDYDFVGMMQIDSKLEERLKSRLEVVRMSSQSCVYTDDVHSGNDVSYSAVTESNTMAELQLNCTPGHRLCLMNGVQFVICITQAFPIERLGLIGLASEFHS
jgi:hypothetical protein